LLAEQKAGGYSTKYRFTGKEVDEETGLYYFGARYYDPRISLWYGVDPMAEEHPDYNPFVYTANILLITLILMVKIGMKKMVRIM